MSSLPIPKYKIGDRVWHGTYHQGHHAQPCLDCRGSGQWKVITPAGLEFQVECVRCGGRRSLTTPLYVGQVRQLTIGSVRIDTADLDGPVHYMCSETGVVSGSVYRESALHDSEQLAQQAAEVLAAQAQQEREARQPDLEQTRRLNTYEIKDALVGVEKELRRKAEYRLNRLLERICELDEHPVAGKRYADRDEKRFVSLTKEQVEMVQESLVWLSEEDSDFLDRWRAESEECEC